MKKALTVTGRVELSREEISKAIMKFLNETENLATEKIVYEVNPQGVFLGVVAYVHQSQGCDEVPEFGKTKRVSNQPKGIRRPNYGVGSLLNEMLSSGQPLTLQAMWEDAKHQFPQLTLTQLGMYVMREKMVGFQVTKFKERGVRLYQKTETYTKKRLQDATAPVSSN